MQLGRYKLQTVIMTNLAPFCQLYNWLLFSLIIILLTDVHVYIHVRVINTYPLSRGYVLIIEIYPEASIIHLVNNQDMNDSYTPVVSMPFFHKQLPMMS